MSAAHNATSSHQNSVSQGKINTKNPEETHELEKSKNLLRIDSLLDAVVGPQYNHEQTEVVDAQKNSIYEDMNDFDFDDAKFW
jgi:hypothetical protein